MAIKDYPLTSRFGDLDSMHPLPHKGLDIALPLYTPCEALEDSVVVSVATNDILGNHIRLKTIDGKIIIYGHLAEFKVKENDLVYKGQIIALSGGKPGMKGAGHSNGAHLHLTLIENGVTVNPEPYLFGQQQEILNPLILPVVIILLFIIGYKARKWLFYGLGIFLLIGVVFLVS